MNEQNRNEKYDVHFKRYFLLNEEEWEKFQEALEQPAKVKPGLQELLAEKAPWE